jgi:hypothetical protein
MRKVLFLAVLSFAASLSAGPPQDGTYKSTDLGGSVLPGRYSESWTMPGGMLQMGNVINKMSWDGAVLGTQWRMYCPELSNAMLLLDTVDGNGNGQRTYKVWWTGGYCELDGGGPWGGGDPVYICPYDNYVTITTITYQNWEPVTVVSNAQGDGTFQGYSGSCMVFSISNMAEIGNTDSMTKPADFPGFLEPGTCTSGRMFGSWGDVTAITITITGCSVPSDEPSWGAVKSMYE